MTSDEPQPLSGLRIVVTRSASQASGLTDRLQAFGAEVHGVTTIDFAEPADGGHALRQAVADIESYSVVALASPNGARALLAALVDGPGPSADSMPRFACVGPGTAAVLERAGYAVDIVPNRSIAEGLVDAVGSAGSDRNRLLLVQAEVSRPTLEQGFAAANWLVDRVVAYRTVDGNVTAEQIEAASDADVICFMSSSSVERYVRLAGSDAMPPTVISVGPITTATAVELGLAVEAEAAEHTLDGLVDAIVAWSRRI